MGRDKPFVISAFSSFRHFSATSSEFIKRNVKYGLLRLGSASGLLNTWAKGGKGNDGLYVRLIKVSKVIAGFYET